MTRAELFAATDAFERLGRLREAVLFWVAHVYRPALSRSPASTYVIKGGFETDSGAYVSQEELAGAFLALDFDVTVLGGRGYYPFARPVVRRNDLPVRSRWAVRRDTIRHQPAPIRAQFESLVARGGLRLVVGGAR